MVSGGAQPGDGYGAVGEGGEQVGDAGGRGAGAGHQEGTGAPFRPERVQTGLGGVPQARTDPGPRLCRSAQQSAHVGAGEVLGGVEECLVEHLP